MAGFWRPEIPGNNGLVSGNALGMIAGMNTPASSEASSEARRIFPNTRWSVVLAARREGTPEAEAALEVICGSYRPAMLAYVRNCAFFGADAEDLTQEFFRQLLEKRWLDAADREKGKLRTFLIVAFKNFLSKERRRAQAQKRGGGHAHAEYDTEFAESKFAADKNTPGPDEAYDRQWALTLLALAMERLQSEFAAAGRSDHFEALKDCLTAGRGAIDYAGVAAKTGMNEGAARVAVHRLRKRFREVYRDEITQTLAGGVNPEEEMRHLAAALARA